MTTGNAQESAIHRRYMLLYRWHQRIAVSLVAVLVAALVLRAAGAVTAGSICTAVGTLALVPFLLFGRRVDKAFERAMVERTKRGGIKA